MYNIRLQQDIFMPRQILMAITLCPLYLNLFWGGQIQNTDLSWHSDPKMFLLLILPINISGVLVFSVCGFRTREIQSPYSTSQLIYKYVSTLINITNVFIKTTSILNECQINVSQMSRPYRQYFLCQEDRAAQFKGHDFKIIKSHLIQALSITVLANILALKVSLRPEHRCTTVYFGSLYKHRGKYPWPKGSKLVPLDHSRLANAHCGLAITCSKSFTRNQNLVVQETAEQQA